MKINYTLPGYRPETDVGKDLVESFDSPFKNRMQAFEQQQPVGWKELLGLDVMPLDPSQIAEPQSETSGQLDAVTSRQQWRDLMSRHGGEQEFQNSSEPVRLMLELLETYKRESDGLFSRGVSEAQP